MQQGKQRMDKGRGGVSLAFGSDRERDRTIRDSQTEHQKDTLQLRSLEEIFTYRGPPAPILSLLLQSNLS